jgi:hypothetical protein
MSSSGRASIAKTVSECLIDLESPDPLVRDVGAASRLGDMIDAGALDVGQLQDVGDRLILMLEHERVEVRSFAALVLSRVLRKAVYRDNWFERFRTWYSNEEQQTGYDLGLGWVHAVAHGADALAAFGHFGLVAPEAILEVACARMLHAGDTVWRDQEDDRLGYAIAVTLRDPRFTNVMASSWLAPIREAFQRGEPGPVPAFASNTMRTLRMVSVLGDVDLAYAGNQLGTTRAPASRSILETLALVSPGMWTSLPRMHLPSG